MGPNIFLFDRTHLYDQNRRQNFLSILIVQILKTLFYILRQKNRKNQNIFSMKIDIKFCRHHFHRKDVFYQINIYLDPYLQGIIDSGPICTFTIASMVGFSGAPFTCDHFFLKKINTNFRYTNRLSSGF